MEFLKNFQAGASVPMCPSRDIVRQSFSSMILSASGFRKIFSSDGIEESASPAVTAADAALTAFIGRAFAEFCRRRTGKTSLTIALGTDTRPTGASLADLLIRIFSADGINVRYSGATAVPELTAWVKTDADIDAFVYVSASHNPIGHNGFKFGFEDGAVMEPEAAAVFIEEVRSGVKGFYLRSPQRRQRIPPAAARCLSCGVCSALSDRRRFQPRGEEQRGRFRRLSAVYESGTVG